MRVNSTILLLCFALGMGSEVIAADPAPTPPAMGWSTFNFFLAAHNDPLFRGMASAYVASGLRDAGYTILRIDGGWWGDDSKRRWYYWTSSGSYQGGMPYQPGDPHVDPANYPYGIKGLADHLHGHGMKLGFYLSPALSVGQSANYPGNAEPQVQPTTQHNALVDQHAALMADSGVDHLFYDGYDWKLTQGTEPYYRMAAGLAEGSARTGRRIIFSINSGWKWRPSDVADEWRTRSDIAPKWESIMNSLDSVQTTAPAGNGHWNNPDYLVTGFPGVSDEEQRSQFSLWCVIAAPLYLSYDFRAMNAWDRYLTLNTEAIAVNQQTTAPGSLLSSANGVQVWSRSLADGSRAVALLNRNKTPSDVTVTWSALGLPDGAARVRDLWDHVDLGIFNNSYTAAAVPAHGCALIMVRGGSAGLPALASGYVPHPGTKPVASPLPTSGWSALSNRSGLAKTAALFDGNPATTAGDYIYPNTTLDVVLPASRSLSRLLLDHVGVGPGVWPLTFYAPRSTFTLSASNDDGGTWIEVASGSLGPAYTPIDFPRQTVNRLRLTIVSPENTTAVRAAPRLALADIYAFDAADLPSPIHPAPSASTPASGTPAKGSK